MRYSILALTLAASLPTALSFLDTFPLVAWSSHSSGALDRLRPAAIPTGASAPSTIDVLIDEFLSDTDVCEFDAVIIIDQPGLHASDLRALSPSSSLATRLQTSSSSLQLPYVHLPQRHPATTTTTLQQLADKVAVLCDAQRLAFDPSSHPRPGSKHVLSMSLPALTESAGARKRSVAEHEARLASELEKIERAYPRHLVILAGSRRQDDDSPSPSPPAGGILARYQLLTPALITSLLLVFFILVPVLLFSVYALASIQSPLRVHTPKGYSADEKKNQ